MGVESEQARDQQKIRDYFIYFTTKRMNCACACASVSVCTIRLH